MKKLFIFIAINLVVFFGLLLMTGQAGAENSIFDSKYTKYSRETYLKYCNHYLTAGGCWDCLNALDELGIPTMGCDEPKYMWVKVDGIGEAFDDGWLAAPLNYGEEVINSSYAPKVYWFYKCPESDTTPHQWPPPLHMAPGEMR